MAQDEEKLIEACRRDPKKFGELYDRYVDQIFHYALHRTASVQDAEDITAQTFSKALDKLGRFKWKGISISAWLYRIATNEIHTFHRKQAKWQPLDIQFLDRQDPDQDQHMEMVEAEEELLKNQAFVYIHQAMRGLKSKEQTLLTLRFFEKKSFAEISEITGDRQGTLIMRCKRTLEKLRNQLDQKGVTYVGLGKGTESNRTSAVTQSNFSPGTSSQTP